MLATIWNNIFTYPILNLMLVFYHICWDNLGIAIILIAILFRLVLLPFMKKQTDMTRKMSGLKPQLDELQKKYKNNPKKLSEEQMKLYKKVGYNPLGCIVTFIPQLIVLSVLIMVIRNVTNSDISGVYPFIQNWLGFGADFHVNTTFLWWDLTKSFSSVAKELGNFSPQAISYMALCVLVGISQFLTTKFTQVMQGPVAPTTDTDKKKKKDDAPSTEAMQKQMTKSMNFIFPISTVFIAVSAPSALSVYWAIQSLMLVVQYMLLDWDKTKKGVQNLFSFLSKKKSK